MSDRYRPSYPRARSRSRSHSRTRSRPTLSRSNSGQQAPKAGDSENSLAPSISNSEDAIPTVAASIDHTLPQEYFKQDLLTVIKSLRISKWHRLPITVSNDIQVKRMSGALTNAIYRIDPPSVIILKNHDLHNVIFPPLLLRIFGPNVDSIIDRAYELKILIRLSKNNIGPKLLGIFTNGRIEQFLDNAITLTKKDITDLKTSARIARRMKELHIGIPLSSKEKEAGAAVLRNIQQWSEQVEEWIKDGKLTFHDYKESEIFKTDFKTFQVAIQKYTSWILTKYPELNKELVFCHNDTQYGNLLFSTSPFKKAQSASSTPLIKPQQSSTLITNMSNLSLDNLADQITPTVQEKKQDQNLVVIDFEYSGPNPPAFDISNHFAEWMQDYHDPVRPYGLDIRSYPSIDAQLNFNYSYVLFRNPDANASKDLKKLEIEAKKLCNDVINWRPAVNIFWSLWAILQNGPTSKGFENIIEKGPNGEQYKIVDDDTTPGEGEDSEEVAVTESDVDNFNYLGYCKNKLEVMWGDLLQLGLWDKAHLEHLDDVKYLSVDYFEV